MPLVIGNVISQEVYNSRLKYKRKIPTKTSCRFIDVTNGREERQGKSWIVNVSMRLHHICFSRINPYDVQRSLMENRSEDEDLNWKDKVFNIDSFQGKLNFLFCRNESRERGRLYHHLSCSY